MRRISLCLMALIAVAYAAPALSHPEPDELSRPPSVSELAADAISNLVKTKKLPASWTNAKQLSLDLRTKNGAYQYVVVFENPAIKEAGKRKLYVVFGVSRELISTGYKLI